MGQSANANTHKAPELTCVVGQSYIPPMSVHHPHIIEAASVSVVMWSSIIHELEIAPWQLICKKLCFNSTKIKTYDNKSEIVINDKHDIQISLENACKI